MAANFPLWNEESGWAALDELTPQQTAMIQVNPGLITGGMPGGIFNQNTGSSSPASQYMTMFQEPTVAPPGGSRNRGNPVTPTGMQDPSFANNNPAYNSLMMPVTNGRLPGELPTGTQQNRVIGSPSLAPTGAQVQANPNAYAGTSFDPNRNLMSGINFPSGGATNMGMTGVQNVGGVGMYTGANGPLNTQLFNAQAGNMQPGLDYVRGIDQVSYYKYILPLQQSGLIDISNPQQVNAAIQQGLARDGGGQWSAGQPGTQAGVGSVAGSPYAAFLKSGDPRAQAINQFMLSGNQNAIAAANDWMYKNVRTDGSTVSQLDNIDAWKQRFNSIYFPGGQFDASKTTGPYIAGGGANTGGGNQQTTPSSGGGQQTPINTNWYQEFTSQNPSQYTQYNKGLDSWALGQLTPSQRNQLENKNDPASLTALRQALDQIRIQGGYGDWAGINTAATGNKAQAGWLSEGYENAPFEPGTDPGQYFKWDWADPDGSGNQMANWFLKMNDPKTYQDVQAAVQYYNTNLKGKGRVIGNPYLLSQGDSFAPIAEALYGVTGNQGWQQYNKQVNDYVSQFLDPALGQFDYTNNDKAINWLTQMDNLRKQMGYFTNSGLAQQAGQPSQLPLTAYGSSPAGTPFRPSVNPLEGFQWSWMDQDGQGPAPGTWGQTMIGAPTTLDQATKMAQSMSQNSNILFGGANLGNIFSSTPNTGGGYTFSPNASYFQPKQSSTPSSGFDFSTLFGSNYGSQQPQQPVSYGYNSTPSYTGTPSQTTTPQTTKPTTPFGGVTNRKSNFANNYSYWG